MSTLQLTIQLRRDTAANWISVNPVLASGEEGYETDTGKRKVGDGVTAWASLSYTPDTGITQLTGDVTAGPGNGSQAATIANGAVTNAKLANVATLTLKGRRTGGTGVVEDLSADQTQSVLDTATDPYVKTSALPAAGITQLTGDVTAGPGSGSQATTLASVIAAGGPTGSSSVVPVITYDAKGRLTAVTTATITPAAIGAPSGSGTSTGTNTGDQTITLTGDVTGSGTGSFAATIANGAVTNTKMANMAQGTIKLRAAGAGTGDPIDGTPDEAMSVLALATDPPDLQSSTLKTALGSDQSTTSASYVSVSGYSLTLAANSVYMLYIGGNYQCAGTTTGIGVSVTMTGSPTMRTLLRTICTGDTSVSNARIATDDSGPIGTTVGTNNSDHPFILRGAVKTSGSSCTVQVRFARGGTSANVTIMGGSFIIAHKIA